MNRKVAVGIIAGTAAAAALTYIFVHSRRNRNKLSGSSAQMYTEAMECLTKSPNLKRGVMLLKQAAAKGHARSMLELAHTYLNGMYDVGWDVLLGNEWMIKAAEAGDELADMYCWRASLGKYAKAETAGQQPRGFGPEKAAAFMEANDYVGMHYVCEQMIESSHAESREMGLHSLRVNCLNQYVPSIFMLACALDGGVVVTPDVTEAVRLYQLCVKMGHMRARFNLGCLYMLGETGFAKDPAKAVELFEDAAEQGSVNAMTNLGQCYEAGLGVKRYPAKAFELYRQATEAERVPPEHMNPTAFFNCAVCWEQGKGTSVNLEKAFKYYTVAASLGHVQATRELGRCHEFAIGTEKNLKRAVTLYVLAARKDNELAVKDLQRLAAQKKE